MEDSSLVYECRGEEHKTFTVSAGDESKFVDFATASQHLGVSRQSASYLECNVSLVMPATQLTRAMLLRLPVITLIGCAMNVPMNNVNNNDPFKLKYDLTSVLKSCLAVQVWAGLMCMHVDWADLQ